MNITIKDIAKALGISYSSVSRALNGKAGVSEQTRETVLEAAEKMGYQPNDLARGLVSKVSNTIGVIVPDINNPYFGEVVKGILESAKDSGYNVFLCTTDWNVITENEYYATLRQRRVDGIILKPAGPQSSIQCNGHGTPLIMIDPYENAGCLNQVVVDNELGGYMAANYLLDCGYENLAFITGKEDHLTCYLRLRGAEKALLERGRILDRAFVVEGSFSIEGGRRASEELFQRDLPAVDAIFGMNDLIALGILQYCTEAGKKVPEDVAVLGYDDIAYAGLPQIQLSTVHQPKYELGQMLFKTLLDEIQNGKKSCGIEKMLSPKIIERRTTKRSKRTKRKID